MKEIKVDPLLIPLTRAALAKSLEMTPQHLTAACWCGFKMPAGRASVQDFLDWRKTEEAENYLQAYRQRDEQQERN